MKWECCGVNQRQTCRTTTAQRFQRNPKMKNLYQQSIDTDVDKRLVKIIDQSKVKGTFGKKRYLPHHPVLNANKPGKVRRVCNAASKYKDIFLNNKLLAGPDLLYGLIGTIFRFREGLIAVTASNRYSYKCKFPRGKEVA